MSIKESNEINFKIKGNLEDLYNVPKERNYDGGKYEGSYWSR